MFTGIVEAVSRIRSIVRNGAESLLTIDNPFDADVVSGGNSVAVDGTCLTVTGTPGRELSFHVSTETLSRTILETCGPGTAVNIERALRPDSRLDGHIVQGHVDCVSRLSSVVSTGKGRVLHFDLPREHASLVIEKGSVAVNGISLTVADIKTDSFSVAVIPETLARTTFWDDCSPGRAVNLEFDILGKYIRRQMTGSAAPDYEQLLGKL